MADEFAKGFSVLTVAWLGWMILSAWYNTGSFESTEQLIEAGPSNPDFYGQIALVAREALFWFAIVGAVTFWVIIPAIKQATGNTIEDSE